jgi:hypothetical protein
MSQLALLVKQDNHTTPQDLIYACVSWVEHICMIKDDVPPIVKLVESFIHEHVLHWFEAMSLLKRFSLAITLLDRLSEWAKGHLPPKQQSLVALVRYWWSFSQEYETLIQECPIEVYSRELLREFQVIEVQEPLLSQPPTSSIFDFGISEYFKLSHITTGISLSLRSP